MKFKRLFIIFAMSIAMISITLLTIKTAKPVLADGDVYYVDAGGGSDSNDGSQVHPWKTISHAADNTPASSNPGNPNIIIVGGGTYDSANGETFPIVLDSDNVILFSGGLPANVIIDGGGWSGNIISVTAQNVEIYDFTIRNADTAVHVQKGGVRVQGNVLEGVKHGVDLDDRGRVGSSTYAWGDVAIISNTFTVTNVGVMLDTNLWGDWSGGDSAHFTFGDIDVLSNTFNLSGASSVGVSWYNDIAAITDGSLTVGDLTIAANRFNNGASGVDLSLQTDFSMYISTPVTVGNVIVERNTFENQTGTAVVFPSQGGYEWSNGTTGRFGDVIVRYNAIINAGVSGIAGFAFSNVTIGDTTIVMGDLFIQGNVITASKHGIHLISGGSTEITGTTAITIGHTYIQSNTVNAGANPDGYGIYQGYDTFGYRLYDSASVYAGNTIISNNRVTGTHGIGIGVGDTGAAMFSDTVATIGEVYIRNNEVHARTKNGIEFHYYEDKTWGDGGVGRYLLGNAQFTAGDVFVENNEVSTTVADNIQITYDKYAVGMGYYNSAATLPDYTIRGNTFNISSTLPVNSVHWHNDSNPQYMGGEATIDFGQLLVDDNTFNGSGVYYQNKDACAGGCASGSTTIFSDTVITDNRFYDSVNPSYMGAVHVEWVDPGTVMSDTAVLTAGKTVVRGNTISKTSSIGISYSNTDPCYTSCSDNSNISFDDITITDNQISNTTESAIHFQLETLPYQAKDSVTAQIGELTIADNVLTDIGQDGVHIMYFIESTHTVSATAGNVTVLNNQLNNLHNDGISVYYWTFAGGDASLIAGYVQIIDNVIDKSGDAGINVRIYPEVRGNATSVVSRTSIIGNKVTNSGSGIRFNGTNESEIINNVVDVEEYGLQIHAGSFADVNSNTIYKPISPTVGSGIRVYTGTVELANNLIAADLGTGIWVDSSSAVYDDATMFDNVSITISGTVISSTGSFAGNADFVDAANDNYHLLNTSNAIDAGASIILAEDRDRVPRPQGSGHDIGAYEYVAPVDLAISKYATPNMPMAPGDILTYTLLIKSWAGGLAQNVVITDIMPAEVTVLTVESSGIVITNTAVFPQYIWQVEDLASGDEGVITITAVIDTPLATTTFTNTAMIAAFAPDTDPSDNQDSAIVIVRDVPPVAVADDYNTPYETTLNVNAVSGVLSNDYDDNGSNLEAALHNSVSDGMLDFAADGSFVYTPSASFNGQDAFSYILSTVDPIIKSPQSLDGSTVEGNNACYLESETRTMCFTAYNNSPDFEWMDAVTVTLPINWSAACNSQDVQDSGGHDVDFVCSASGNVIEYIGSGTVYDGESWGFCMDVTAPAATGLQMFDWNMSGDGWGDPPHEVSGGVGVEACVVGNVTINVAASGNNPPTANNDSYATPYQTTLNVNAANGVLDNDSDPDFDMLTAVLNTNVSHGSLTLNGDGSFAYTPATGYSGDDMFSYIASDGALTDTAVVTITVAAAINNPPVANNDSYATPYQATLNVNAANGVLDNDSDPDFDALTAVLNTNVSHGSLTLNGDGSFAYTPATGFSGDDMFSYIASDGALTDTAAVTITVGAAGVTTYTLSVTIVGEGEVFLSPFGTQGNGGVSFTSVFTDGTLVTLDAIPDMGWDFDSWSGDGTAVSSQWQVLMNGNKSVTATFTPINYQIYLPVVLK